MQRVFQKFIACIMCSVVIFGAVPAQAEAILTTLLGTLGTAIIAWITPKALDNLSDYMAQNNNDINAIKQKAQNSDVKAIYNMVLIYYLGKNVEKNYSEALLWWCKAANEHDYAEAQYSLGQLYYKGEGVIQNYSEAFTWYKKAAEQGHTQAQNILGCMYKDGCGVLQNYSEAIKWFTKSAEQGSIDAQNNLGLMYSDVMGNYTEAAKWFTKAVEKDDAEAEYNLGLMYYLGDVEYVSINFRPQF